MLERMLLVGIVALLSFGAFALFRRWHLQRASSSRPGGPGPALLYFRSDRCAPCITQSRLLAQLPAQLTRQVAIQQVDTALEPDLASRYGVFTIPTTLLIDREGVVRHINYGVVDAGKLTRQVESVI